MQSVGDSLANHLLGFSHLQIRKEVGRVSTSCHIGRWNIENEFQNTHYAHSDKNKLLVDAKFINIVNLQFVSFNLAWHC